MPIGGLGWLELPYSLTRAFDYLTGVQAERERKLAEAAKQEAERARNKGH